MFLESFFVPTMMVALAELGDKTQLLSLYLICKFRKRAPIIWGILLATVINHAGAAYFGQVIAHAIGPEVMRWILGLSFLGMAVWALVPDKLDDVDVKNRSHGNIGIFITSFVAFFMAEMGDKTQIATIALAAKYQAFLLVVAGSTLGMMIANVPVVFFGKMIIERLPLVIIHRAVAALFVVIGIAVLVCR